MPLKLEIGSRVAREDWHTLDVHPSIKSSNHYRAALGGDLPIRSDTYDIVYGCHVIEHVPWTSLDKAFSELFRIIKPGGILELHTVNFCKVVEKYMLQETDGWDARGHNPDHNVMAWVNSRLLHFGEEAQWHKTLFDPAFLKHCFEKAGFVEVERGGVPRFGENHGPMNLEMRARKPE